MNSHLKYFYSLVHYGSFTEAAEEMYISQPALSQHIKALEKEVGVKLISRAGRKLELTAAGKYFYYHSKTIFTDYEKMCEETKRIAERGTENLTIGYLRSCDGLEVHHTVSAFNKRHPDITIDTIETTSNRLSELLNLGKIDIALCEQKDIDLDIFIKYPVVTVNCLVEISSNNPLAEKKSISVDDLKFLSGILVASGTEREIELSRFRDAHGFPNNFLFANTLREARMLVVSGKGFIPIDGLGNAEELKPSISRINLYENNMPVLQPYYAYWKINNDKVYIKEFVDILRAQFSQNGTEENLQSTYEI